MLKKIIEKHMQKAKDYKDAIAASKTGNPLTSLGDREIKRYYQEAEESYSTAMLLEELRRIKKIAIDEISKEIFCELKNQYCECHKYKYTESHYDEGYIDGAEFAFDKAIEIVDRIINAELGE